MFFLKLSFNSAVEKTISTLISSYQVMLPKALKARNGDKVNIKYITYVK